MPIVENSSLVPNIINLSEEEQRNYESFERGRSNARTNKICLKKEVLKDMTNA